MEYQHLLHQREGAVLRITLNRPEKRNALSEPMLSGLRTLLTDAAADTSLRVVIVNGAGTAWSAGVDLELFQHIKVEPGFQAYDDGVEIIRLLETMPQVSIAMLNGPCFTGALELMLAFDLVWAAADARIGDTHAKWGIPPKWGMTQRLQQRVGLRKAKEMSFTAIPVSGEEAERLGLVNKAVPPENLEKAVEELAAQIASNSAQGIAAMKHLYHYGSLKGLEAGIAYEQHYTPELTDKTDTLKHFRKNI